MITTCTNCQARYQLDDERIPPRVIKVRCPSCSGVFALDGTQVTREEPLAVSTGVSDHHNQETPVERPAAKVETTPEPAPERAPEPVAKAPEPAPVVESEPVTSEAAPAVESAPETEAVVEMETGTATAVMETPAEASPRRRRSKEEMLARALVSDIMVYNRDLYDKAKVEDNLLEALGPEIKKSWELYKQKVTPEVANSTDHFRDALNDILADGDKVF
jgi:predicted Zn finger-like uncharacterized protein